MKKLFALLIAFTMLAGTSAPVFAQGNSNAEPQAAEAKDTSAADEAESDSMNAAEAQAEPEAEKESEEPKTVVAEDDGSDESITYVIKEKFIEGGPAWMTPVLIVLILGLAVAIERIITLSLSTINKNKFVLDVEAAVKTGGVEAAKEVCRNTRGPIASIFYQGLDRSDEGIEVVEKTIVSYGSVQMGQLEKGMVWISLFIALAPMLGFMGTVIGMIGAFDDIEQAGDISPTVVAGGIKIALLTTVAGLIVAIVLQLFYNYIVNKIDTMVNNMEEASIDLVDILVKNGAVSK